MKWINTIWKLINRKEAIIIFLVISAILGGGKYISTATNNWLCATREIDFLYSKLESSKIADDREKYQALNEIIENKNAIDKTYFDALSGGFFAVGVLISIASLLSGFKFKEDEKRKLEDEKRKLEDEKRKLEDEKRKSDEQKQSFKLKQEDFEKAVALGALRIDVSSSSNVELDNNDR